MSLVANREHATLIDALNARMPQNKRRVFLVKNVNNHTDLFAKYIDAIEYIEDSNKFIFYTNIYPNENTIIHCFIEKGLAHKLHCSKMEIFRDYYQENKHCPQIIMTTAENFLNDSSINILNGINIHF